MPALSKDSILKLIDAELSPLKREINQLKSEVLIHRNLIALYSQKLDDVDQYSRRLNLVLKGFKRETHESPASIRNKVVHELKRLGLQHIITDIDRAHRYLDRSEQAVIVRFSKWNARNELYKKRFDCTWRIQADITHRRQDLLEYARAQTAENDIFKGIVKSVGIDRNCSLFALTITGKLLRFNSKLEFATIIHRAEFMCRKVIHLHTFLRADASKDTDLLPGPKHSSDCATCDLSCYRDCKCACCCRPVVAASYADVVVISDEANESASANNANDNENTANEDTENTSNDVTA